MSSIFDDEIENESKLADNTTRGLLDDWISEQTYKLERILGQIKEIKNLTGDSLDELCNHLDDIDYHTAGLSNILNMVTDNSYSDQVPIHWEAAELDATNNQVLMAPETPSLGRWPLLYALWFHMMMATDPDSIYYSPNIGSDAWNRAT